MENLQKLLEDLAHLHEQVLGPLELNLENISRNEWLPAMLRPWEELARQKRLEWIVSLPAKLPIIKVDPTRFSQIIGNLLSNAIKFTPPGGQIKLSADVEPNQFWLQVSDNGPGVPAGDQEKIFDPFYRADQKNLSYEGMGLGLSIVRDLVQAHQGRIVVTSDMGKGGQFTISLPLSAFTS